jgi:predicted neuraminidase
MIVTHATRQFIYENNQPFRCCHASTVLALPGGNLLAAWFGGSEEGDPDVDIWYSLREGGKWSVPRRAAAEAGLPHWNPVLFQHSGGDILLYYKVGHTIPAWSTRVARSTDGGKTWCTPGALVEGDIGGRGPVRNKPIVLRDGTWLAPASIETEEAWDAFVDRSTDGGRTWTPSGMVPLDHTSLKGKGIIQPVLWETEDGRVHMLLRSTGGFLYRSESSDKGRTWSAAYPTSVPNNNSGIDLVKLPDGTLVLAHNPVSGDGGARTPLICSVSRDNGHSWKEALVLEQRPGEYSYPSLVAQGNRMYLVYTWNRERIACWEMEWA